MNCFKVIMICRQCSVIYAEHLTLNSRKCYVILYYMLQFCHNTPSQGLKKWLTVMKSSTSAIIVRSFVQSAVTMNDEVMIGEVVNLGMTGVVISVHESNFVECKDDQLPSCVFILLTMWIKCIVSSCTCFLLQYSAHLLLCYNHNNHFVHMSIVLIHGMTSAEFILGLFSATSSRAYQLLIATRSSLIVCDHVRSKKTDRDHC